MSRNLELKLPPANSLFTTQEERDGRKREKIMDIPLAELRPFKDHPFQVTDNEELRELAKSIAEHGVVTPAIVRPNVDGTYELISGHRRKAACEIAGIATIPVVVRDLDDDTATVIMVDSNQQRENILPSEKAFAYKMKLEALKHQGKATSQQLVGKLESADFVGDNESGRTVQRYYAAIKQCLDTAVRKDYILRNPLDRVDRPKRSKFPPSFCSRAEAKKILKCANAPKTPPATFPSCSLLLWAAA
jgi:ParB-like partition proteins